MALRPDPTAVLKAFEIVVKGRGFQPRRSACHSDAERGGGICDTEELCVRNVFAQQTQL